jgi:hypothetical protein
LPPIQGKTRVRQAARYATTRHQPQDPTTNFNLQSRRALVMGGTKGLGRSIADALAEEGATIAISG